MLTVGAGWHGTLATATVPVIVTSLPVTRLAGADRYATSAAISTATYAPGVPVAYIATGLGFADALSGAPAAAQQGGPLLLVPGTSIPSVVATELARLQPGRIVVLGGTSVVSAGVASALDAYTTGTVTRLAGADRYATSAAISTATYAPGVPVAYIATGLGFADALSGAPAAAQQGGPLLLVPGTSIPSVVATELARLQPGRIVVLGGTSVVSAGVASALDAYVAK
jgi:putative cell wall-binding protein